MKDELPTRGERYLCADFCQTVLTSLGALLYQTKSQVTPEQEREARQRVISEVARFVATELREPGAPNTPKIQEHLTGLALSVANEVFGVVPFEARELMN